METWKLAQRTALAIAIAVAASAPAAAQPSPPTPQLRATAAAAAPAAAPAAAAAPAGTGTNQKFGSWVLACPPADAGQKGSCVLIQQLSETLSRKVVFVWLMQYDDKGQLMAAFRLPTGVFINRGLIMKTAPDAEGVRIDYEQCGPTECQALFPVTKDLVKQFSAAKSVSVTIALTNGQAPNVQLGMDGFAGALAALAAQAKVAKPAQ